VPFDLEGRNGLLAHVERRLDDKAHAMLVVAEGAGQSFVDSSGVDAGGNPKLGDIGLFLKGRIASHFSGKRREVSMKYIDPSYTIRSQPAIASDSIYCARLGSNAVHAAMSGRTACLVGMVNNHLVHVPIGAAAGQKSCVNPDGPLWRDVVADTGQPALMTNG
jgi:6-phosphofructokinase 1